jgi:phosphopantothenoylcysteine decarboxylase
LTERAKHFVNVNEISAMAEIFTDQSEWQITKGLNEQSLHLELVQWADIFIISPLDANTLGKISSGICDNLLTCVARAWDLHKPLLFCPEMNTRQFLHPITNKQIEEMKLFGYYELPSISETLLTEGSSAGALSEINYIIDAIFNHVQQLQNQAANVGMTHNHGMHHPSAPSPLNDSKSSTSPMSAIFQQAGIGGVVQIKQQKSEPLSFGEKPFTCDVCGGKKSNTFFAHDTHSFPSFSQGNSRATRACGLTRPCIQVTNEKELKKFLITERCIILYQRTSSSPFCFCLPRNKKKHVLSLRIFYEIFFVY